MRKLMLFGMWILLIACEPGDLVNLPSEPERITILSYNQVGEPWFIVVTTTMPTTQRNPFTKALPNAIVTIYEDGKVQEQLPVDTSNVSNDANQVSYFRSKTHSPRPEHTYKIVVEAEGLATATAQYVQPAPVAADITFSLREKRHLVVQVATTDNTGTHITYDTASQWTFNVVFTFTDPPGSDYYDFWIRTATDEDSLDTYFAEGLLSVDGDPDIDPVLGGQILSDENFDRQKVKLKFVYKVDDYETRSFPPIDLPNWFRVSLRTMNEAQYKFNIQSRKQQLAQYDPYAQPITTYTNVKNGLGVFGGYTPYSRTFNYELH